MADLHTYKKLPSDPCLTQEQITAYIDGQLSSAEQHACEQHILDCEMCEDAVEGLALVKDRSVLAAPVKPAEAPTEGKVIPLQRPNRRMLYAVAAILVLVLGATFLISRLSYDGASPMAENKNAAADSTAVAPGEGYALKNESGVNADCLAPAQSSFKAAEDREMEGQAYAAGDDAFEAPKVAMSEHKFVAPEETEESPVLLYDLRVNDEAVTEADVDVTVAKPEQPADKKLETVEQQKETKKTLLGYAKDGIASGNAQRAEKQRDTYFDDNRNDGDAKPDAPVPNNVAQTTTQTQGGVSGPAGAASEHTDTSSHVLAEVTMVVSDSLVTDQLELSYRNGVDQLKAGQANSAIVLFDKVLTDKNHARYEDAEFQKAKALIKANRKEEAKTLLKAIEAKKGRHAAEATELLKTI